MIYIENDVKDAAFHFSAEEYIMREYPLNRPVLMLWQTEKCVMLGNYQVAEAEIDMGVARKEDVQIVRRPSGGGTIYTDLGTFLITIIMPDSGEEDSQQIAKEDISKLLVEALDQLGISAEIKGRNDITVASKKITGVAQYSKFGKICSHASLLFDADLEMLTRILRVDDEKIRSKAIKSVRSRVTNIKEHMETPCSTQEFFEQFKKALLMKIKSRNEIEVSTHRFSQNEFDDINKIREEKYANPSWTIGRSPKFSLHNSKRFAGGKVEVYLDVDKGILTSCSIRGDFLGVVPIRGLEAHFENSEFQYQVFCKLLDNISLNPFLGSITKDELLSCFFDC